MITKIDLQTTLSANQGNLIFAFALQEAKSSQALFGLLSRYITFNSLFAGGVASLAGSIAVRHDLFQDASEPLIINDRSIEVAAAVLYAAIDEFGDRATSNHATHRTLAQATIKGVAEYFHIDLSKVAEFAVLLGENYQGVLEGYGLVREGNRLEEQALFQAIGFHISSEILADGEFGVLDSFLKREQPGLVQYLKATPVSIGNQAHEAYYWIEAHTTLEVDHFDFALKAANEALRYYVGPRSQSELQHDIIEGFRTFASLQTSFMRSL